jgi:hypothetical protein
MTYSWLLDDLGRQPDPAGVTPASETYMLNPTFRMFGAPPTPDRVQDMSLRDWFAGQVLMSGAVTHNYPELDARAMAVAAYTVADAMMVARAAVSSAPAPITQPALDPAAEARTALGFEPS